MAGAARAVGQAAPVVAGCSRQLQLRLVAARGFSAFSGFSGAARTARSMRTTPGTKLGNFTSGIRPFSHSSHWRSAEAPAGGSKVWESADAAVADIKSGSVVLSSGFGLCGVACESHCIGITD